MKDAGENIPRGHFLERYLRGEHEPVWAELRGHAALTEAMRREALDVSRETMGRVLRNAELLISRLAERGCSRSPGRSGYRRRSRTCT